MVLEVGTIVEGRVTGITKFGAFVDLGGGKNGLVHISEVAVKYVKAVEEFLTVGQTIKVMILSISEDGKINLSVRRAQEKLPMQKMKTGPGADIEWGRKAEPANFEDMLSKFKSTSDEKMSDLKRMMDSKRGTSGKRNSYR